MQWHVIAIALLVGCKGKSNETVSSGGATGSAGGSGAGSAVMADAAVDATPADASSPDAAAAKGPTITREGVGKLVAYEWYKKSEDEVARDVEDAFAGLPDIAVSVEVMDTPQGEQGYWSVRRGKDELAQVLPQYGPPDGEAPARVVVWHRDIPTHDGTRVGDPVATLVAKHASLACTAQKDAEFLVTCRVPSEPEITYVLDARQYKGKATSEGVAVSPQKVADIPIVAIAR